LLAAALAAILVVLWQTGSMFGTGAVVLDEIIPRPGLEPFAQTSTANSLALIFCLATGTASLPFLLMRSFTTPSPEEARESFMGSLVFGGLVLVAAPAFATLFDEAWLGYDLFQVARALLALGAIAVLLAAGSAIALSIGNALSYDVYYKTMQPRATTERQVFMARLSIVVVAGLAGIAALYAPQETLTATSAALSVAASALLPALMLGVWWKRASSDAALAAMIAGLVVCLYYMIAPQIIPFVFYESSTFLSSAGDAQTAAYEALRHDYYLAADPAVKEAVLADWENAVRPMANWWGVNWAFAGLFAVPVGFAVMVVVSVFTPAPSEDVRRFVQGLREGMA